MATRFVFPKEIRRIGETTQLTLGSPLFGLTLAFALALTPIPLVALILGSDNAVSFGLLPAFFLCVAVCVRLIQPPTTKFSLTPEHIEAHVQGRFVGKTSWDEVKGVTVALDGAGRTGISLDDEHGQPLLSFRCEGFGFWLQVVAAHLPDDLPWRFVRPKSPSLNVGITKWSLVAGASIGLPLLALAIVGFGQGSSATSGLPLAETAWALAVCSIALLTLSSYCAFQLWKKQIEIDPPDEVVVQPYPFPPGARAMLRAALGLVSSTRYQLAYPDTSVVPGSSPFNRFWLTLVCLVAFLVFSVRAALVEQDAALRIALVCASALFAVVILTILAKSFRRLSIQRAGLKLGLGDRIEIGEEVRINDIEAASVILPNLYAPVTSSAIGEEPNLWGADTSGQVRWYDIATMKANSL